jgi:hypothetical protein
MPKAARVQVASPPAGTALARAIRGLPSGPRPCRTRFDPVCNIRSYMCQRKSDTKFRAIICQLTNSLSHGNIRLRLGGSHGKTS